MKSDWQTIFVRNVSWQRNFKMIRGDSLTLFEMGEGGGHDAPPQMFLTIVLNRSAGGSWNFVTFNINLWSIKKLVLAS